MSTSTTPAPTRPARPAQMKAALTVLLPTVAGAGFGYLVGGSAVQMPWLRARLEALVWPDAFALPLLILLVLAVHELGHLAGGIRQGMRFLLLIVGPFQWSRSAQGIRFNWVFNLGTLGGVAAATPNPQRALQPQLQGLVLGGPLASLLLALAGIGVGMLGDGRVAAYALVVGALSAMIFLVTATPLRAGGFMSDGMQWLELRRGGQAVHERQLLVQLMGLGYAGQRPRDWDPGLVGQVVAMDSNEPLRRCAARSFALYHALDRGDTGAIREHAQWLAENHMDYPDGFRQAIHVELCMLALSRGDRAEAQAWWRQSRGGVVDRARRALAAAMLAHAEGDRAGALDALRKGRRELPRGSDAGMNQLTAAQLDALEQAVASGSATTVLA